jgi:hypothetical protein
MSAPAPHTSRACLLPPSRSAPQYHPLTVRSPPPHCLPAPRARLPACLQALLLVVNVVLSVVQGFTNQKQKKSFDDEDW